MPIKSFHRKLISVIALISFGLQSSPGQAANLSVQSKKVLSVFQSSKSSVQDQLDELEKQFELDMDQIDENSRAKEIQIEKEAIEAAAKLDSISLPQIQASQKLIDAALKDFSTAGVVEVIKELRAPIGYSAHPKAGSYLACPKFTEQIPVKTVVVVKDPCFGQITEYPLPQKISKWDPTGGLIRGEYWQPGDKTNLVVPNDYSDKRGYFVDIDQMISASEITPINFVEFSRVSAILKTEPLTLDGLKSKYEREKNAILVSKSKKISENNTVRESQIDDLESEFNSKKEELQALQVIDELGIIAAKRASKNLGDFDKAFSVAFRFEYNKQQLELIANDEWNGDLSYRSINTLAKVLTLLDIADSIAAKYSFSSASKFNSSLGTAFTRNAEFRSIQKYVSLKYQKATGKRTSITV